MQQMQMNVLSGDVFIFITSDGFLMGRNADEKKNNTALLP